MDHADCLATRSRVHLRAGVWCLMVAGLIEGFSWVPALILPSAVGLPGSRPLAPAEAADLVVIGNSRSAALDLEHLRMEYRRRLHREPVIVDLRLPAGDGLNHYSLFKRYGQQAARPPVGLIVFFSLEDVLDRVPTKPEGLRLRDAPEFLRLGMTIDELLNLVVAKANWLSANKSQVNSLAMEWMLAALHGSSAQASHVAHDQPDWNERLKRHAYMAALGHVDRVKVNAMRRLIKGQATHGKVLVVVPPYHADLAQPLEQSGSYQGFLGAVASFQQLPDVTVVSDQFFRPADKELFFDPTHLSEPGRAAFTDQLLRVYAEQIMDRWNAERE